MKKIFFVCLMSFLLLCPMTAKATTREEIVSYVNEKQAIICDRSTKQLFNTYRLLFTRMLKEKELNSKELDQILNKLKQAVTLIEEHDVCKESDLQTLSGTVRSQIKDYLYAGMMIIYDAPPISSSGNNANSGQSGIVIDKNNNTVDIYQDGNLYDKVDLSKKTFNYVGPNPIIMTSLILLSLLFVFSFLTYLVARKKTWKYQKLILDTSISLILITAVATPNFYIFRNQINQFLNLASMLKQPMKNTTKKEVIINESHEIISYPAYGDEYGTLKIDDLHIHLPIKFGDSKDILVDAIGHTSTSFLPGEGGTILMSGHNSDPILGNLRNISKGTKITLETSYGVFTYQVEKIETMSVNDYDQIEIQEEEETLILYTCYPFGGILYGNERYVVTSKLVKEEWREEA